MANRANRVPCRLRRAASFATPDRVRVGCRGMAERVALRTPSSLGLTTIRLGDVGQ
jgi:hypothetical protein